MGYGFTDSPNDQTNILQTSLSGESNFKFIKMKAEYGISYSKGKNYNLGARTWGFGFVNASTSAITDPEHRKLDPTEIVPLFTDNPDKLLDCQLASISTQDTKIDDDNFNAYLNFSIPIKIGSLINGNIKFGGMFREKKRFRDDTAGTQGFDAGSNVYAPKILSESLDWMVRNSAGQISAIGIRGTENSPFLNGDYNFGNRFNFDRLNEISNTWERLSNDYIAQGPSVYLPLFGQVNKIGYSQSVAGSTMNDQDILEKYFAGYLMSEINFGKYVMFLPGVRIENTLKDMKGYYAMPPIFPASILDPLPATDTTAVSSDTYILPMIHLRIKPTSSFYMHFAYTQTLSRPDFNAISPNYYVNSGWVPFTYSAGNPLLKPELWTNMDAQFVFHGKKIGLFSVNLFYKTVKDKIWNRSYQRIKGDPIINPFPDNGLVNVATWENHSYTGSVNGVEIDWQSSFGFLPSPFKYITLSANYTYTNSQTSYPYTRIDLITPIGGGRPVAVRIDSTLTGAMKFQPKHIANVSLGFNKNGFNAWLSFQYNGQIYTPNSTRESQQQKPNL